MMMNPFQLSYIDRLREWRDLRNSIKSQTLEQQCIAIDHWWQQAPVVNHHYHWHDTNQWTDPWEMLSENIYCPLTRAVGMCYTMLMNDINDIELIHAQDQCAEDHYLVIVNNAKYVLNYWPDTVISNDLSNFKINSSKSLESIKNKIK
jgi:hypothetical protein